MPQWHAKNGSLHCIQWFFALHSMVKCIIQPTIECNSKYYWMQYKVLLTANQEIRRNADGKGEFKFNNTKIAI
jgi:hypothetical protein